MSLVSQQLVSCLVFILMICVCTINQTNAQQWGNHQTSDSVLLSDVKALTFQRGSYTTGKRSSPIPQLQCVGGDASSAHQYQPTIVQCRNMGEDYSGNIQWKCEAELDSSVRFGRTDVSCEGYNNPNDPYILRGSCGLEYSLEYTEQGKRQNSQHSNYHYSHFDNSYYGNTNSSNFGKIFLWVLLIIIVFGLLLQCSQNRNHGINRSTPPNNYGNAPGYGGPGYGGPSYGAPSYGPGYGGPSYGAPSYGPGSGYSSYPSSYRPGFWSGVGTGGMFGYLFGRNSGGGWNSGWGSGPSYRSSGFSSSFGGSTTRTSSGFGSTRKR